MVGNALQRVFNLVGVSVDDEDATVVHLQPDVLCGVHRHGIYAVVQTSDAAGVSRLVVVEIIAIEARHAIPRRYPDVSVVVVRQVRDSVAGQSVVGGIVGEGCLHLLGSHLHRK